MKTAKRIFITLLTLIPPATVCLSQSYVWTEKAHYGGGEVYDAFSFVVGSKAYVGTGRDISLTYFNNFWEYNPATDSWTQLANLPGAVRFGCRTFSIGNSGYVVSGYSPVAGFLTELWEYNTVSNLWIQRASHPGIARYTAIAFALNNKGYFGLGSVFSSQYQNDFYEYDPATNMWAAKPNFPGTARQGASEFVINNVGYVGLGSNVSLNLNFDNFYKYDAGSNTWSPVATFPGVARNGAFSFSINGKGYIVMGYDYTQTWPSAVFHDFWEYDSGIDSWTQLQNFPDTARYEGIYFEIGNRGYLGVGSDTAQPFHYMGDLWEWGPEGKPTGIVESTLVNTSSISVYVGDNILHLSFPAQTDKSVILKLFDISGKLLRWYEIPYGVTSYEYSLLEFSKGILLYNVEAGDTKIKSGKIIIL